MIMNNRVMFFFAFVLLTYRCFAQPSIKPDFLLVSTGSYFLVNTQTNFIENTETYLMRFGAGWGWNLKTNWSLAAAPQLGFIFPPFEPGIRPFLFLPVYVDYKVSKRISVQAGAFLRRDFFATRTVFISGVPVDTRVIHPWEVPLRSRFMAGLTAGTTCRVGTRSSVGILFEWSPRIRGVEQRQREAPNYRMSSLLISYGYLLNKNSRNKSL
jgi:hypothetical protein